MKYRAAAAGKRKSDGRHASGASSCARPMAPALTLFNKPESRRLRRPARVVACRIGACHDPSAIAGAKFARGRCRRPAPRAGRGARASSSLRIRGIRPASSAHRGDKLNGARPLADARHRRARLREEIEERRRAVRTGRAARLS